MSESRTAERPAFAGLAARRTLREEVLDRISAAINTGELAPGVLVTVPTLAEQFRVSATPVREALLDLEQRGFVESVRNKGYRVTEVSEQDLVEIVQLRRWLEVPAVRIAAESFPTDRRAEFAALAAAIVGHAARGELGEYLAADWAFHSGLLELTGNRRLVDSVYELRRQTRMVGLAEMRGTPELLRSAQEHQQLLDLLLAGDSSAAAALLHDHIGHVLGWWMGRSEQP